MRTRTHLLALGALLAATPLANAELLYAVTMDNTLLSFDSANPGTINVLGEITTGVSGEEILGLDFRPSDGGLYALGSSSQVYRISTSNGSVLGSQMLDTALMGTGFGFDWNPTNNAAAVRIISDQDQNLRHNANTDTTFVDGSINPSGYMITGSAYANNVMGATTTTLYGIDAASNSLVVTAAPNTGTYSTVGSLGVDASRITGFDISGVTGVAYVALNPEGLTSELYTVDLATGQATLVNSIGGGEAIRGLTAQPVPEPASMAILGLGAAALLRRRKKA